MNLIARHTLSSISNIRILKYHLLHSSAEMARHLLGQNMPSYYGTDKSILCHFSVDILCLMNISSLVTYCSDPVLPTS